MNQVQVLSRTQKIIVDSATTSVSITNAGPPGPPGINAPDELALLSDVDLTGATTGNVLALLAGGKWGPADVATDAEVATAVLTETTRAQNAEDDLSAQLLALNNTHTTDFNALNLSIGSEATRAQNAEATISAALATVANDSRFTDERTPLDGSVTLAKIVTGGLAPSAITGTAVIDTDTRLTDQRVPTDGSVTLAKLVVGGLAPSAITGTAVIDADSRLTDQRVPTDGSVTSAKIAVGGLAPSAIAGTAVIDTDARLSDSRSPIGAAGGVLSGTYPNPAFAPAPSFTGQVSIVTGADATKGLMIRRNSGTQSANLQEWQTEAGAAVLRVSPSGALIQNNSTANNLFGSATPAANVLLTLAGNAAANIPLVVKGAASQSADLQQWQDSAGALLAQIASDGSVRSAQFFGSTVASKAKLFPNADTGGMLLVTSADTNKGLIIRRNSATQTADLLQTQNESGTPQISLMGNATPKIYLTSATYGFHYNDGTTATAGRLVAYSDGPPNVVGIIRGAAAQTGDLQQWQDSSGASLALVSSAGIIRAAVFASTVAAKAAITPNGDTGGMLLTTAADTNKGLAIRRNSATVGANLFEIQDEAGSGKFVIQASMRTIVMGASAITDSGGGIGSLSVYAPSPTAANMVLKAQPGQTSNMTEWQNSSAGLIARVTSTGSVLGTAFSTLSANGILGDTTNGAWLRLLKLTATPSATSANQGALYFRDGTTVGTLKLVAIGPGGVEKVVVDNIA